MRQLGGQKCPRGYSSLGATPDSRFLLHYQLLVLLPERSIALSPKAGFCSSFMQAFFQSLVIQTGPFMLLSNFRI
jgi:hypothetical protein